ncbi:hypothetical protein F4604DRAFT_1694851 [Suillus subluteus]|nr:hypothetical protein F4604DRAFT_1694851 [Suillus subluteus]
MPHIKKTSCQQTGALCLNLTSNLFANSVVRWTAAKSAEKCASTISGALPQPIRDFRIPVSKAELSMGQWDARAPQRIHYGVPELISYEYWLAVWKCWDGESKKNKKKQKNTKTQKERADLIDTSRKNAGARFLQAMLARRIVLEECIANGVNDERIKSLDEFLIRDHRDWLFVEFDELPDDADMYLAADPLHQGNNKMFETGWGVNVNDISIMLGQADDAWMSEGLDLSEMFKKEMDAALKRLRDGAEEIHITHDENAELPDRWHEVP